MRHVISVFTFVLCTLFLVIISGTTAGAQTCPHPGACQVHPTISLKIGTVTTATHHPVVPIEHQTSLIVPVTITFTPPTGIPNATEDAFLCWEAANGQCNFNFSNVTFKLSSSQPISRTLKILAPSAGTSSIVIDVCEAPISNTCSKFLTKSDAPIAVAANYSINILGINVLKLASPNEDTLFVAQWAIPVNNSAPLNCAPINCTSGFVGGTPGFAQHDHPVLDHPAIPVGPFKLTPSVDPALKYAFAVVNFGASGYSPSQHAAAQNLIVAAVGGGLVFSQLDPMVGKLKSFTGWKGCDGPVAANFTELVNDRSANSFVSLTEATGAHIFTTPVMTEPHSNGGNGCHQSSYQITWRLSRTTWKP